MMFSRPLRSECRPARTSSSAPSRPFTSTLPAYGYITPVRIFSSVDLPDPLAPTRPTAEPGSISRSMSFNTQRYFSRSRRRPNSLTRSRSNRRVRSARKRFHMWLVWIVPSGNIGEPELESAEQANRAVQHHDARDGGRDQQAPRWTVPVEHRLAIRGDHCAHRIRRSRTGSASRRGWHPCCRRSASPADRSA